MAWPKGKPRPLGAGRKAGTPNKLTVSVKEALTQAFENIGGVEYLTKWAKREPTAFFALYSKLVPHEMQVSGVSPLADMMRLAEERRRESLEMPAEPLQLLPGEPGAED